MIPIEYFKHIYDTLFKDEKLFDLIKNFCSSDEDKELYVSMDKINQLNKVIMYIPGLVKIKRGNSNEIAKVLKPINILRESTNTITT